MLKKEILIPSGRLEKYFDQILRKDVTYFNIKVTKKWAFYPPGPFRVNRQ